MKTSFLSLAMKFQRFIGLREMTDRKALAAAAALVLKTAKGMPGTYQGPAGPFPRWHRLEDATIARKTMGDSPLLETGKMAASYRAKVVSATEAWVGSDYKIAVYQEIGTRHIPPRPVLGMAAAEKQGEVAKIIGEAVYMTLATEFDPLRLDGLDLPRDNYMAHALNENPARSGRGLKVSIRR